jgi:SRSO17 transposase
MKDIHQKREVAKLQQAEMSMLNIDESDFLKKGKHSAGVARQYYGLTGTTDNCQAGVFMSMTEEHDVLCLILSFTFQRRGLMIINP